MKIDSITCFWQQLFYSTELNSTSEIKPSLSVATVVVQYSKLLQPFLSLHTTILLLCWGRVLHHETKHSTEVTRFNRYFINNNKKKKKKEKEKKKMKINIIIIIIIQTKIWIRYRWLSHNTDFEIASTSLFRNYYILRYYIMR